MKKIKNILTVIGMTAILGIFYAANLPSPTTLDYLSAPRMWTLEENSNDIYSFMQISRTELISGITNVTKNKTISGTNPYYLSDSEVTVFDSTKVGKVENGKFIIVYQEEYDPKIYEIKSLSSEKLVLFYDSKGKNVPNMTTSTWHAKY